MMNTDMVKESERSRAPVAIPKSGNAVERVDPTSVRGRAAAAHRLAVDADVLEAIDSVPGRHSSLRIASIRRSRCCEILRHGKSDTLAFS